MKKIQLLFAAAAMATAFTFSTLPAQALTLTEEDVLLEEVVEVEAEENVEEANEEVTATEVVFTEEVVTLSEEEVVVSTSEEIVAVPAEETPVLEEVVVEIAEPLEATEVTPIDLSTVVNFETYRNSDFTLEFPFEYDLRYKDGLEITQSYGPGYSLTSIVCPMGVEEMAIKELSKEGDVSPILETRKNVTIDGLELKVYDTKGLYSYYCRNYSKMYTLNSGEKTYLFIESTDLPSDWWSNHLKWNFDGKTTKSSSQILSDFSDFFRSILSANSDKELKFTEEGNQIKVTIKVGDNLFSKRKAANTLYTMTNMFTVFKNFSEQEYDFTFEFYNTDGTLDGTCTFNYPQYSKWNGPNPIFDLEEELQSSTMEQPEKAIGG